MTGRSRPGSAPNLLLSACCLVPIAMCALAFMIDPDLYLRIVRLWRSIPREQPFLDMGFLTFIGCFQHGRDVYVPSDCDPFGRAFVYSPLWLRFSFLPTDMAGASQLALGQAVVFGLSLAALPKMLRRIDTVIMIAAVISPATAFAIERGNPDLLMFVIAVFAMLCLERGPLLRVLGYGAILLAGALKFYPVALLLLLVRERLPVFFAGVAISLTVMAGFVLTFRTELSRVAKIIPHPDPMFYNFGAEQLARGFALIVGLPVLTPALLLVCVAGSLVGAMCINRQDGVEEGLRGISRRQLNCLAFGAVLVCGCFFAGVSLYYRAVDLLFVLPGLLGLAEATVNKPVSSLFSKAAYATLAVLWIRIPMAMFGPEHPAGWPYIPAAFFFLWLIRELLWWFIVTVLISLLARLVLASPFAQGMFAVYARRFRPVRHIG